MDEDATKAEKALTELLQMQCAICEAPKPTEREWAILNALAAGTVRVVPVDASAERVTFGDNGLDEVVTCGGAHLERMSDRGWFLEMVREDGSSFCVTFGGEVLNTEERAAPAAPKEG